MSSVTMRQLLEAGVHFGHQTKRWNPKMKPYIYGERNGIYIINLQKSMKKFKEAYDFVRDVCSQGETVLFIGTKKQAQQVIQEESARAKMYYVTHRWLGGMLTNFATIKRSVTRWEELEAMKDSGGYRDLGKKEIQRLEKERMKLEKNLSGIRKMNRHPGVVFIVDTKKEHIAVKEANKLKIPVVAIVDTNCDPDEITFPIPGNDDAIRAIRLITSQIANAAIEGREIYKNRQPETVAENMELDGEGTDKEFEEKMLSGSTKKQPRKAPRKTDKAEKEESGSDPESKESSEESAAKTDADNE